MIKRLIAASAVCLCAGCSILPERPPVDFYGLTIDVPQNYFSDNRVNASVQIYEPTIVASLAGNAFYTKGRDYRFYKSEASRFLSDPTAMIGSSFRTWFTAAGPWKYVYAPNSLVVADYAVTVSISKLYVDFPTKESVVAMTIQVTDARKNTLVAQFDPEKRIPINSISAKDAAAGYAKAIQQILEEITPELQNRLLKKTAG